MAATSAPAPAKAVQFLGEWVRYIGLLSAGIALVGFAVGRFVVEGED